MSNTQLAATKNARGKNFYAVAIKPWEGKDGIGIPLEGTRRLELGYGDIGHCWCGPTALDDAKANLADILARYPHLADRFHIIAIDWYFDKEPIPVEVVTIHSPQFEAFMKALEADKTLDRHVSIPRIESLIQRVGNLIADELDNLTMEDISEALKLYFHFIRARNYLAEVAA